MTPLDMAKLFSSFMMAAFLVWLTNYAERDPELVEAPEYNPRQHATAPPQSPRPTQSSPGSDPLWNVSSFFGFKQA